MPIFKWHWLPWNKIVLQVKIVRVRHVPHFDDDRCASLLHILTIKLCSLTYFYKKYLSSLNVVDNQCDKCDKDSLLARDMSTQKPPKHGRRIFVVNARTFCRNTRVNAPKCPSKWAKVVGKSNETTRDFLKNTRDTFPPCKTFRPCKTSRLCNT